MADRRIAITCDPEGRLRRVPWADLKRFQGNMKTLSEPQYAKLRGSIEKKGFFAPIFLWAYHDYILDGHQRLNVMEREIDLGHWQLEGDSLPVVDIEAADEKDAAEKLLLLSSTYGKIDPQGLYEFTELHEIPLVDFTLPDLPDFDFDAYKVEYYLDQTTQGNGDPEAIPEVPVEPVTQPGDLWLLGDHRLLCGDCTVATDVERLMNGERAEMVWTDPPYGVGIGDKNKYLNSIAPCNRFEENMVGDKLTEEGLRAMLADAFDYAIGVCRAGAAWYVAAPAGPLHVIFCQAVKDRGVWRQTIQWVKQAATFSSLGVDYHWQAEPILYGWLPNGSHRFYGGRVQTTVWNINRPMKSPEHPTMKPVELVKRAIENSTLPDEIVLDMFAGSGTTGIAAEDEKRQAYMMEIQPSYCDVIVRRWQDYTGQTATLDGDGQTFAEMAKRRGLAEEKEQ